jgi:hypothetical protein
MVSGERVPSHGTVGESTSAARKRRRHKKQRVNCVWLETANALADEHVAQILGYLRSSRVEHGLLINFGAPKFEIKKYALSRISEGSRPGGLIGGVLFLFASLAPFRG